MTRKVALITGGSRGIGAAIARHLAEQGFDIAISFARNQAKADEVAEHITALGRKIALIQADGSTVEGNQRVIAETVKQLGRLDVLVCNAGIGNASNSFSATNSVTCKKGSRQSVSLCSFSPAVASQNSPPQTVSSPLIPHEHPKPKSVGLWLELRGKSPEK